MYRTSVHGVAVRRPMVALLAALSVLSACSGGGGGGSGGSVDLFLQAFLEDGQANLKRDRVLTFEFTSDIDAASVDQDTIQVFRNDGQRIVPFIGRYEVDGRTVRFHPVVDEGDPNRGTLPLNPYGFNANGIYEVVVPSITDSPPALKTLRDPFGKPIIKSSRSTFSVSAEFTADPAAPNPAFEWWSTAAQTTTPDDDVLTYLPAPDPNHPPLNPQTNQPDYRAEHPSQVQLRLTFSEVIDPRSIRTNITGNLRLEFLNPATQSWTFVASTARPEPNGRSWLISAATALAHKDRENEYRLVLDQSGTRVESRAGKSLLERVVGAGSSRQLTGDDLKIWTAKTPGEEGPLLTAVFPIESFVRDAGQSDSDVRFSPGRITAGPVVLRLSEDTTPCTVTTVCSAGFFREPLTQSFSSSQQNPNPVGPSKVQFLFNSPQHAQNRPAYRLPDAEVLSEMFWSPFNGIVYQASYPKLRIHVEQTSTNSTIPNAPASLPSTIYDANVGPNAPGFAVRDGTNAYVVPTTSAGNTWYPWKFERPYQQYRADRGLVFTAWTETGGETEQYMNWYWIGTPSTQTMLLSGPSTAVNPSTGQLNRLTYYWTRFEFKRKRSLAVTKFIRLTTANNDQPNWDRAIPSPGVNGLPGGTAVRLEYRGGRFAAYRPVVVGGRTYYEGIGNPTSVSQWTTNVGNLQGFPAIAIRAVFEADVDAPNSLPFIDGLSFTYSL